MPCQPKPSHPLPPRCAAVEAALQLVPGVQSAAVSLTVQQAEVRHAASACGKAFEQSLVDAVEGCGFEATGGGWAQLAGRLGVGATGGRLPCHRHAGAGTCSAHKQLHASCFFLPIPTAAPAPACCAAPLPAVIGRAESCQQLLRIEGMTCSACSSAVEAALRALPGVHEAGVNLLSGVAEVGALPLLCAARCESQL